MSGVPWNSDKGLDILYNVLKNFLPTSKKYKTMNNNPY